MGECPAHQRSQKPRVAMVEGHFHMHFPITFESLSGLIFCKLHEYIRWYNRNKICYHYCLVPQS